MVEDFFDKEKLEYVFLVVVKVGGIYVNRIYLVEFLY